MKVATLLVLAASCGQLALAQPILGGLNPKAIETSDIDRLSKALGSDEFYSANIATRLCYVDIVGLEVQVVAGYNYRYQTNACSEPKGSTLSGKCADEPQCKPELYNVTINERMWENALKILDITRVGAATLDPKPSPSPIPVPTPPPTKPSPSPIPVPTPPPTKPSPTQPPQPTPPTPTTPWPLPTKSQC